MQTLDSLAYALNHIFLRIEKAKTYNVVETNDSILVEENYEIDSREE